MITKRIPGEIWLLITGIIRRILRFTIRPLFAECGHEVSFNPFDQFSYKTIKLGNNVFIGKGACFSSLTCITIGNKVIIGPNVTIMGGDHNTSVLGKYMADVKTKRTTDDVPVKIGDDVWVGTGVIILKGVSVGRGAIIGAGAVVNCNVEPYSVVGGIPAKHLKFRWTRNDIMLHEQLMQFEGGSPCGQGLTSEFDE